MMYCILVTGIPASGKSTLCRYLAKELGLASFSKDDIKELLFDTLGFQSRAEKVKLGTAAMEMMYYAAAQTLKSGQPCIMENNFEDASQQGLRKLLETYHCTAITIRLTGDHRVIYDRFSAREKSPERHRGHIVNDRYPEPEGRAARPMPALSCESYLRGIEKRGFDRFAANGPVITVDVTDYANVDYAAILQQVNACIQQLL